jgi:hypothetical protein
MREGYIKRTKMKQRVNKEDGKEKMVKKRTLYLENKEKRGGDILELDGMLHCFKERVRIT